ncbi:MAG: Fic family protein [Gemmatimonadota bacterium]|nr:Fic family protein [Gemmatimonadota bacterium]
MRREDFGPNFPGRLVPTLDRSALAFVPDPLPPAVEITSRTLHVLVEASDALGELRGIGRTLPNPALVIRPFARREAILSSRIEGTTAGFADLAIYEASDETLDRPDDVREVANYLAALDYSFALLHDMPVCNRLIRLVHERLLKGVRGQERRPGEFRQFQNAIGILGTGAEGVRFMPPPVKEMTEAMHALEVYIGSRPSTPSLLVQLALIHYQFETIHPFMDGNGRMGRLLIPVILRERGFLPTPLLYLSAYFDRHKEEYKDRLLAVSQQDQWDEWIGFFLTGVAEQSREAIAMSDRLLALQSAYRDQLTGPRVSVNQARLVDFLFEHPAVTASQVARRLDVSTRGAYDLIKRLVERGILEEVTGRSYNQIFLAQGIAQITVPEDNPRIRF